MRLRGQGFVLAFTAVVVCGCATISPKSTKYDPSERSLPGTIVVSDPKLYSREALISERSREMARLQELIDDAPNVQFTPDIYRDVERISALSAALGLKFDPAAGLDYRRDQEGDKIQHEINQLRLQLQLDQLKRDAEILRSKLPEQTAPVNPNLGVSASAPLGTSPGKVEPEALDKLKTQIDALIASMKTAFAGQAGKIAATDALSSPFDRFRDQQAYLDLLKSARNAASLDDLHDYRGSALVRLNFQVTVVPDPKAPRSLGVVQVSVKPKGGDADVAKRQYIDEWMLSINAHARVNGDFGLGSDVAALEREGAVFVDRSLGQPVAMPSTGSASADKARAALAADARWGDPPVSYSESLSWLSSVDAKALATGIAQSCGPGTPGGPRPAAVAAFMRDVHRAKARIRSYDYQVHRDKWSPERRATATQADLAEAERFLDAARGRMSVIGACAGAVADIPMDADALRSEGLLAKLDAAISEAGVRIYEVGPREQAQQMSTSARAADSMALALSIAAAAPGSGRAANAALGYSRQAVDKVSALERVPSVVGYTVGGKQTFGWVLGPRAVVDAKHGSIDIEQRLKPYDLSVDMSVPAWWRAIELQVETKWGPQTAKLVSGELAGSQSKSIVVPIDRKAADFDWFTSLLLGSADRGVRISQVSGTVNACFPSVLLLEGRNVWRAQTVMVLGQSLTPSDFSIAPDMRGIVVKAPAISPRLAAMQKDRSVWVISPHGRDRHDLDYVDAPSGDACKDGAAAAPAAAAKQMAIASISPDLHFAVPSDFTITVQGKNLDLVKKVTLHGQAGVLKPLGADRLEIAFSAAKTRSIPADESGAKLEFFDAASKPLDTRAVRISRAGGT